MKQMKNFLFIAVAILFINSANAQLLSFGLKGGVNSSKISFDDFSIEGDFTVKPDYAPGGPNYDNLLIPFDANGETKYIVNPEAINKPTVSFEPSSYDMGFHFGAFARIKVAMIFVQPELIFSQTNANINVKPDGFDAEAAADKVLSSNIKYNNFDVPVLVGVKLGPAHFCVGPVATFKLNSSIDDQTKKILEEIEREEDINVFTATKNATFGAQVGTGLTLFDKLTLDVRYEFGLSKLGESVTIGDQEFKTDQRQNQFIGSIGWMF